MARQQASHTSKHCGTLPCDFATGTASANGTSVHLTPIEYRLLAVLIAHRGKVMTHRELLREVWGPSHSESSHYLRVYMANLRKKLEQQGQNQMQGAPATPAR